LKRGEIYRRLRACKRESDSCKNSDSKESLKEESVILSPLYALRSFCVYDEFENIVMEVGQIIQKVTKGRSCVFTSPSSFMICIGETLSVFGCEDSLGSTASEYGSML
jgi:hypothetical protein